MNKYVNKCKYINKRLYINKSSLHNSAKKSLFLFLRKSSVFFFNVGLTKDVRLECKTGTRNDITGTV